MSTLMLIWDFTWLFLIPLAAIAVVGVTFGIRAIIRAVRKHTKKEKGKVKKEKKERKKRARFFDKFRKRAQEQEAKREAEETKANYGEMPTENVELNSPSAFLLNLKNNYAHNIENDRAIYAENESLHDMLNKIKNLQNEKTNSGLSHSSASQEKEMELAAKMQEKLGFNPMETQNYDFVASVKDATGKKVYDKRNAISLGNEILAKEFADTFDENYDPMSEPEKPIVGRFDKNNASQPILYSTTSQERAGKAMQLCLKELAMEGTLDASIFPVSVSMIVDPEARIVKNGVLNSVNDIKLFFKNDKKTTKQKDAPEASEELSK